jgi:PAS domain S-box-containing protein
VITSWNRGAQKIFGYTAAETIGRPVTILMPPEQIDEEPGILRRIRSGESIDHYETIRMRKDGSRLHISLTVSPIRDARGRIVGASKIARDITERKQNEAELAAHARRAGLLSEMAAQLLLADSPRTLQAAIFHGLAREMGAEIYFHHVPSSDARTLLLESSGGCDETLRAGFAAIPVGIHAVDGDAAPEPSPVLAGEVDPADLAARLSARVPAIRGVASHALKTGERLLGTLVFASTTRDRFADTEVRFMQTVCDLVAASVERARLLSELRQARDVAEAASRAKDDFLATLSHELRTPLNPVLLLASDAAEDASLPANVRADFATIQKNVELEARLIDDLLDVTRITRGKLALEKRLYDAHAILRDAISIVQGDADQKEIELTWNLAASKHVIVGDAVRLQQVFWNVLKNALKFTPPGGRVAVETRVIEEPARLCVTVEDSGIGMTRDELERVFEAFAQGEHAASASTHRFGGLGLGLAISRALIQIHGGVIRAESRGRGKGSTFFIELPLHGNAFRGDVPGVSGPRLLEEEEVKEQSSDDRARESILLVDDHESTRHTLMRLLERRGYSVKAVATMAQARAVIGQHEFDLLISDIGLPDGSGNDLMRDVRQKHPRMRGIALSGHGAETDIARTGAAGFAMHLTKPVRIEELDRVLTRLRGMDRTDS